MSEHEPTAATGDGATDQGAPPAAPPAGSGHRATAGEVLRWVVAGACAGAAAVHFAYAPAHMDVDAVHGAFFLAVAWTQLGLAFSVTRWGAARWPWWCPGSWPECVTQPPSARSCPRSRPGRAWNGRAGPVW